MSRATLGALVAGPSVKLAGDAAVGLVVGELSGDRLVVATCGVTGRTPEHLALRGADFTLEVALPVGDMVGDLWVDSSDTCTVAAADLTTIGAVTADALARTLRHRVAQSVQWFHGVFHAPRDTRLHIDVVPYSGRVFDHRELQNAVEASLDFWLTSGRWGDELQRNLADLLAVRRTILTNSGSSANLLAVSALRSPLLGDRAVQAGSEILTGAVGFPTTVNPILQNECVPVLVDSDPVTGNVDVDALRRAVTDRTRAVILAHTLGNPFDIAAVQELCDEHGLWLIEDACDALGSMYGSRQAGSFGDMSTLSFYPAHHITTGEGGAVNVREDPRLVRARPRQRLRQAVLWAVRRAAVRLRSQVRLQPRGLQPQDDRLAGRNWLRSVREIGRVRREPATQLAAAARHLRPP